jgi:RNA polymerase sigma factor (sigma-70 family)
MAKSQLAAAFQRLCGAALAGRHADLTDGELLEQFVGRRDEAAFEALLRRHGPMVWGVCRRVLHDEADAEDAFQATFLVLVRKAAGIRPRGMVGNWLYGVAQNTARKAKAMNQKRRARDRKAALTPRQEPAEEAWHDLQPLLDQELPALPDKYRAAIVLCDLEGKSIKEAARHIGWPQGTVATRLRRGRALLARRLARHGLTLLGGGLAAGLAQSTAAAGVPQPLLRTTLAAASWFAAGGTAAPGVLSAKVVVLTEGVLKMMLLTRLKTAALVVLTTCALAAAVARVATQAAVADERPAKAGATAAREPVADEPGAAPPAAKQKFENATGWAWFGEEPRKRLGFGTLFSTGQRDGRGYIAMFETDRDGALNVILAYGRTEGALDYRPVAFDADRKRHELERLEGAGQNGQWLRRFRLDPKVLPTDKAEYLGFEYLSTEGRRRAADETARRLRKAGVEVLPWPEVGKPYDFALTTMDGKKVSARDLKGRVILIDCWATWCGPCMSLMPEIKELYERYHKDGLEIVGISFDQKEETARRAIKQLGLAWPQILGPTEEAVRESWADTAGIEGIPRLFLIDRDGILRADSPAELEKEVSKLMTKPPAKEPKR